MNSLWPWLAVAAAGALHGMNPATGWVVVACAEGKAQAWRALVPIALGHAASVAVVAAAVPASLQLGIEFDPLWAQGMAAVMLVALAACHLRAHLRRAGLALWSFIVGTAHGAGWMLVPALAPLCIGDAPAREITAGGSLLLALAAVGVHMAAMLVTTALMAAAGRRGVSAAWMRMRRQA